MPELPEVETIVNALVFGGRNSDPIIGRVIDKPFLYWHRTLSKPEAGIFLSRINGQVIQSINRRAKFIVIQLSNDVLLFHLRMSGDLRVEAHWGGETVPLLPHDRLALGFKDGSSLVFNDPRKFGRVWLVSSPEEILSKLGPEPLEESLTAERFYHMLHERHRQIKPLLMDQHFLAGLGNIYTDEALFKAHLHPLHLSDRIREEQVSHLLTAIKEVLQEGIKRNGASIDWVYRGGDFQNSFNVYQRDGKPCYSCGTKIERILVGQRGSHFCPNCQKLGENI